ncbi:MAG: hypothetical protein OEZ34_14200 [Spirochaetia bacterium]|nr:hypothetical protein [Spirochaetia bacterium]
MLHELYEDMDPDYRSADFYKNSDLIGQLNGSRMKRSGLNAQNLLNESQLGKVQQIRLRRLADVLGGFAEE